MNTLAVKAILGLGLVATLFFSVKGCVDNHNEMVRMAAQAETNATTAQNNADKLQQCESINRRNAELLFEIQERAEAAETNVAVLIAEAELRNEAIASEEETMREAAPDQCYRLDEPYPDEFIDWLRG